MRERGFTLIETVMAVLIIGISLFGLMHLFQGTVSTAFDTDQAVRATQLARERLERMIFDKKMNGYNYIVAANYPAVENFTGDFSPFSRRVSITEVRGDNLTTPAPNTGYKRVVVTVSWDATNRVQLETLVTQWNE